ncbi:MAG: hypothetical protein ACRED9_09420 [Caulobacteraceae bacterium]
MPKSQRLAAKEMQAPEVDEPAFEERGGVDLAPTPLEVPESLVEAAPPPILSLQELLAEGWEERGGEGAERWPHGVTILVCGACSLALWGLIIWGAASMLQPS